MSPLAGNRIRAEQRLSNDHTATNPGPEYDREYRAISGSGTVCGVRKGKAIRIIGEADRPAERRFEISVQWSTIEPGRIRILNQPARRRDRPRHADTDRRRAADLVFDRRHDSSDRLDRASVLAGGSGDPVSDAHDALAVDRGALDFAAAEIDSDMKDLDRLGAFHVASQAIDKGHQFLNPRR